MRTVLCIPLFISVSYVVALFAQTAQTTHARYERGTIMAVSRLPTTEGANEQSVKYEVSIKVRNTLYVVLYQPPNGANSVEYSKGMNLLVSVSGDTLTFASTLTGTTQVPILRREALPTEPAVDWSKAPGQYFEMKMQNLTDALDLTREQQVQIRPMVEQEASEASQFCFTTVIPKKERMKRWEKLVRSSDERMKSLLSPVQWEKLQQIRKEQKNELNGLVAMQR